MSRLIECLLKKTGAALHVVKYRRKITVLLTACTLVSKTTITLPTKLRIFHCSMCLKLDTYMFLGIHGLLSISLCVDAVIRLNLKLKSGPVPSISDFVDFLGLRSGSFRLCSGLRSGSFRLCSK